MTKQHGQLLLIRIANRVQYVLYRATDVLEI